VARFILHPNEEIGMDRDPNIEKLARITNPAWAKEIKARWVQLVEKIDTAEEELIAGTFEEDEDDEVKLRVELQDPWCTGMGGCSDCLWKRLQSDTGRDGCSSTPIGGRTYSELMELPGIDLEDEGNLIKLDISVTEEIEVLQDSLDAVREHALGYIELADNYIYWGSEYKEKENEDGQDS
jgi:hypothetical protein